MPTNRYGVTDTLLPCELFWRDNYDHILQHGYKLRPRYHPDWVPSWKSFGARYFAEDRKQIPTFHGAVNDARRCADDARVVLKRVDLEELAALQYMRSLPSTPQNRTVPVLDVIHLQNPKWVLIVMPFLGRFHEPPFQRLVEVIYALHQIMTGIAFMHSHNVAHRDACLTNFVMDTSKLIPSGFHFCYSDLTPDMKHRIKPRSRFAVNVPYYIIDFEFSMVHPGPQQALDHVGQDKTVPEYKSNDPYDPFKLDIYQVGNMIRRDFLALYVGLDVLTPIAEAMTCETPTDRPTASEVVRALELIANVPVENPWIYLKDAKFWTKKKVQFRNKIRGYADLSCWRKSCPVTEKYPKSLL
ncbi:hypothetical protein GGX14DRAFT_354612 [Mycena pura]|uniref:Protein kinase domain-containing protein n=1 Tax=Mycena pura TaxID=153505 RepID=A0AAD6VRJ6_9AGAR|nr:hypothetical protein GGX14DRAFT_354612 [Mycena pura]